MCVGISQMKCVRLEINLPDRVKWRKTRDPHNHDHLLSGVNHNDMLRKQTSSRMK